MHAMTKARPAVAAMAESAVSMGKAAPSVRLNWGDGSSTDLKNPTARVLRTPVFHTYPPVGPQSVETEVVDSPAEEIVDTAPSPMA
ncbi:hypothetical protein ABH926_002045 [Catenulispora sp. GP43]|uniref:hypothetical protein n=1 Tax=Catenulispora sp. GP43 TaxID=3156263 RepID=UPI003515BE01